jgi:hypothetical protein
VYKNNSQACYFCSVSLMYFIKSSCWQHMYNRNLSHHTSARCHCLFSTWLAKAKELLCLQLSIYCCCPCYFHLLYVPQLQMTPICILDYVWIMQFCIRCGVISYETVVDRIFEKLWLIPYLTMKNTVVITWRMRWAEHVALMGEKTNLYRLLMGKPEGKRPLGRPRQY